MTCPYRGSSLVCLLVSLLLGLNIAIVQLINLLATPVDIALIPFFLRFGEVLMRVDHMSLSPSVMVDSMQANMTGALVDYGLAFGYAILGIKLNK